MNALSDLFPRTRDVIDRVGGKMKDVLKPIDYAVRPSDGKSMVNGEIRIKPRSGSGRRW